MAKFDAFVSSKNFFVGHSRHLNLGPNEKFFENRQTTKILLLFWQRIWQTKRQQQQLNSTNDVTFWTLVDILHFVTACTFFGGLKVVQKHTFLCNKQTCLAWALFYHLAVRKESQPYKILFHYRCELNDVLRVHKSTDMLYQPRLVTDKKNEVDHEIKPITTCVCPKLQKTSFEVGWRQLHHLADR